MKIKVRSDYMIDDDNATRNQWWIQTLNLRGEEFACPAGFSFICDFSLFLPKTRRGRQGEEMSRPGMLLFFVYDQLFLEESGHGFQIMKMTRFLPFPEQSKLGFGSVALEKYSKTVQTISRVV